MRKIIAFFGLIALLLLSIFIVMISFGAFNQYSFVRKMAWNNVTDEYNLYLKIKDVKNIDEFMYILDESKVKKTQTKDNRFKVYDMLVTISNNEIKGINSPSMETIFLMENTIDASIKYTKNGEKILCYTIMNNGKFSGEVIRVGDNEYYELNDILLVIGLILMVVALIIIMIVVFNEF